MISPPLRSVPGAARVLVVAAAVHLVLVALGRGVFDTEALQPANVVGILAAAAPFLLAAAIRSGMGRWPLGRRWLIAGAVAFTLKGVLDLGLAAYLLAFAQWHNVPFNPDIATALNVRGLLATFLGVVAPVMLGMGLWSGSAKQGSMERARRRLVMVLVLLGIVATAGGFAVIAVALTSSSFPTPPGVDLLLILTALHATAFAFLAIVATRIARGPGWRSEVLISVGATAIVAGSGWLQWLTTGRLLQTRTNVLLDWSIVVPDTLALIGLICIMAGFFAGFFAATQPTGARLRGSVAADDGLHGVE